MLASVILVWVAIDPSGMRRYPQTVRVLNEVERWKSYSPQSLAISLGAPLGVADVLLVLLGLVAVAAIVLARSAEDERVFGIAVVAALVATPILWLHYLALLLVPISLARPRLSPLWFLPTALWATPHPESLGIGWRIALVLGTLAITTVAMFERREAAPLAVAGGSAVEPRNPVRLAAPPT